MFRSRITHDAARNAAVQINGRGVSGWRTVADTRDFRHLPPEFHVDAVYYAVSDGLEVQFRWHSNSAGVPFLPLSGRGKIDFAEVTGLHNLVDEGKTGHVEMRVLATREAPGDPEDLIYTIVLDLSKHNGA